MRKRKAIKAPVLELLSKQGKSVRQIAFQLVTSPEAVLRILQPKLKFGRRK